LHAPTSSTQKLKLIGKGGQFTYTPTITIPIISLTLATSSTRVLINGDPGDVIQNQPGLRQGDPLFPMLFILVMDVLNSLIVKAGKEGLLQPLSQIFGQRLSLYAGDITLFIKPLEDELQVTREILNVFSWPLGYSQIFIRATLFLPVVKKPPCQR
jgi:hypothetical protein